MTLKLRSGSEALWLEDHIDFDDRVYLTAYQDHEACQIDLDMHQVRQLQSHLTMILEKYDAN